MSSLPLRFSFTLLLLSLTSWTASARMPDNLYASALQAAQKKVDREKAANLQAGALSTSQIAQLTGKYYQVGDSWTVVAWRTDRPIMRRTSDANMLKERVAEPSVFRYEVTSITAGLDPKLTLSIIPVEDLGIPKLDARVERIVLEMNERAGLTAKKYWFVGKDAPVATSPQGVHSSLSLLELFPLGIPSLVAAEKKTATRNPALPQAIEEFARKIGYSPVLSRSAWLEEDDFFGRPVELLWEHGKPWPSYLRTPNGIALLVSQEAS